MVRYTIDGRHRSKSFRTRVEAERYRGLLLQAVQAGGRFDETTGEPESWQTPLHDVRVHEWSRRWLAEQWQEWQPRLRVSPSSATKMMPKLIRKASMRFLRGCGQDESWIAIAEACRHHFTKLVRTECDQCIEGDPKYIATTAMSASPMVPLASRRAIAKVTPK